MVGTRFYYWLKPVLPRKLRIGLRRWHARRRLKSCGDEWPIKASAASRPEGWPGWPGGKQFAFVLTHDVESKPGLDRVRELAGLEVAFGYRSSFNLTPEGSYHAPRELREWLTDHGFEVGVHDLHHDGKLYWSRSGFRRNAERINHYLKEWQAVGFRSGFMFHRLDWLHDLEILYDASTFDTDPFEPQPDGMGTIFPFWVPGRQPGKGYIELPYTLNQDSSLYLILQERSSDIWKRKLDWVAGRGGMALLNTHPDYIEFGDKRPVRGASFPVSYYEELLKHVRTTYGDAVWLALPKEVASYCASFRPLRPRVGSRRVCMLSYSFYEVDNRVRRYAETLAKAGDVVEAVALRRAESIPAREVVDGVTVHRIQTRRKDEKNQLQHLVRLCGFFVRAAWLLRRLQVRQRFDLVHVHNIPDFLVYAALFTKAKGARVILDIHDIVPEFYANKFASNEGALVVKALMWVEKAAARFADHVIVSNDLWYQRFVARSAPPEKTSVIINHVDSAIFHPRPRKTSDGKFILAFPGTLAYHQGVDLAIKAFARVQERIPQAQFHIHGHGGCERDLMELTRRLNLQDKILFLDVVPISRMPDLLAKVDLGVVPKRADSFGNEAYSTKIMEFMSQGVPVIVSRTKIDSYYFNDSVVCFFEPENVDELAECILRLAADKAYRRRLVSNAFDYVKANSWETKKAEYLNLVDSLCCERKG